MASGFTVNSAGAKRSNVALYTVKKKKKKRKGQKAKFSFLIHDRQLKHLFTLAFHTNNPMLTTWHLYSKVEMWINELQHG